MRELVIGGQTITNESECFVIAEIGHNHQGDLQKAKALITAAKESGATAVKFQKRDNKNLYTEEMYLKPYDHENSFGKTYGAHREFLEFSLEEFRELKQFCRSIGILFFATVFDFASADLMNSLEVPAFKLASGDLRNIPLMKHVASMGKPVIISTGGGSMEDVLRAYETITPINTNLAILQCTASYPTEAQDIHLEVIKSFREAFPDTVIGFSDHFNGISMAVAAYLLGARIIEKHFTLNHTWKGTDHALSLEPIGLKKMVRDLRRVRLALGNGVKSVLPSEKDPIVKMGKKLVAARHLSSGHVIQCDDIAIKSPGDGLPPYHLDSLIGRKLICSIDRDTEISFDLFENEIATVSASQGKQSRG